MTTGFVGRKSELALLQKRLALVTASGAGTALVIRGRRQVGKSRLAQEFCDRAGVPYLFFTATKGASPVEAITAFLAELSSSSVPRDQGLVPAEPMASWPDAFRVLASVLPDSPLSSFSMSCHGWPNRMRSSTVPCRPHGTGCCPGGLCSSCC